METKQYLYEKQCKKELNDFLTAKLEKEINKMKWQLEKDKEEEDSILREIEHLKRQHDGLLREHYDLSVCYESLQRTREQKIPDIYKARDREAFLRYIYDNRLCINSFLQHYQISNQSGHCNRCTIDHRNIRGMWHPDEMRATFPLKYSKFAALCQVTYTLYDRGRVEEARKLYRAIWQDKDGFFSSEVAPID